MAMTECNTVEIQYRLQMLFLVIISLMLVAGCKQESQAKPGSIISPQTKHYSNNGLSLNYPHHWVLAYDESPSLYADRDLAFNTSESSRVSVLIFQDRTITAAKIAEQFVREQRLNSSDYIKNLRKETVKIAGFGGLRLRWLDTMVISIPVEVTIIKIGDSPLPTYVVSQLFNEDIAKESAPFIPFIKSISLQ